jgi:hypothetical protein
MGSQLVMDYALNIRDHNKQAHIDIEEDIQAQKDGLFTFTLRINGGNIVDYNLTEYVPASKYLRLKGVFIQELTVSHNFGERSQPNPIRADNL